MLKIFLRLDKPPELAQRRWGQFTKEAHRIQGAQWQKEMLPDHFTRGAPAKYHHQPRRPKYLKIKRRARGVKYGGNIDNVYTGAMEQMLKSSAAVKATSNAAVVRMVGPRYITMRRFEGDRSKGFRYGKNRSQTISKSAGLQPDKKAEVTFVTEDQASVLSQTLAKEAFRQYDAWREPRTITI